MMKNLAIRKIAHSDFSAWDSYVDNHNDGSFFHLTGWQHVISKVFGHKHHYLLAEDNDQLVGVLPLFEQKSRLFGHALISTPFCVYGGVIADNDTIRKALEQAAYELGCSLNVDYIELRDKEEKECNSPWQSHCHHATFSCELASDPDAILSGVKRKQRAVIRQSHKNSLHADLSNDPNLCYQVYAESVRNLGTPVFHQRLFHELKQTFGERCETLVIRDSENTPVSSVLSFYYKNQVLPYYGGGITEARHLKSNDFMYYQLMCEAQKKGATAFDFGRSKIDSGAYKYKRHWGMDEKPLHYRTALVKAKSLPNLSPNNPKYRFFIQAWQKLPLGISCQLGPILSKYLG
ncbi:FemAB family XrtA/PEP-CTERM system-associated protein [Photobacterium swingsii]|uniref:FemAB family XrtA/PEP-CTERM system-associated protein n=1 Tax=Photobacterium swingsii TaxID=680026 RepID=UPI00352CB4C3